MLRHVLIPAFYGLACMANAQDSKNLVELDHWYAASMVPDGHTAYYNEVWGFEQNGQEYAVIGSQEGTHILQINGNLLEEKFFVPGASQGPLISNRDFMDHKGYLYAVCDQGYSSLQVVDLHQLPQNIEVVYDSDSIVSRAHTVWIDAASDQMYVGGPAGYAMFILDIGQPTHPDLVYVHTAQAYIHDMYVRNDTAFLNAGYEGLHIYRFSGSSPYYYGAVQSYPEAGYNHSGKLSPDGKWYVFTDETDGKKVKLYRMDDLTDPQQTALFSAGGDNKSIAHDAIFWKDYIFVAYYYDGLVVFDARDKTKPKKIAWFNPYTGEHLPLRGNWGVYVLPSGKVLMSDRQNGLYLLEFLEPPQISGSETDFGIYPNPLAGEGYFYYNNPRKLHYRFEVFNSSGQLVFSKEVPTNFLKLQSSDFSPGVYHYRFSGTDNDTELKGKMIVL